MKLYLDSLFNIINSIKIDKSKVENKASTSFNLIHLIEINNNNFMY